MEFIHANIEEYFETKVENTTENNRLRVMFPTGLHEEKFHTKTPFDFAE